MARGDNQKTVVAFMGAVNRNDKNGILSFFREDSVFHNIPMQPAIGPEAIWKIMERVHGAQRTDPRMRQKFEALRPESTQSRGRRTQTHEVSAVIGLAR